MWFNTKFVSVPKKIENLVFYFFYGLHEYSLKKTKKYFCFKTIVLTPSLQFSNDSCCFNLFSKSNFIGKTAFILILLNITPISFIARMKKYN